MKALRARATAKVGRFFWSWGFLKFVLWTITLIVLLYVEEDWRGARAWAATKAKWEARGETFDLSHFTPPPVPDDQNIGALPLFKLEPESPGDNFRAPLALRRAMRNNMPNIQTPKLGNWQTGELPDITGINRDITADFTLAFKDTKPPEDALAQHHAFYPFLTDFIADATARPLCRFDGDYDMKMPAGRPFGLVVGQIDLSKILTIDAILHLDQKQPDAAMKDIAINFKLAKGAGQDPSFVGGLVKIGAIVITGVAIYDGLAKHAWNDAQLAELDRQLGSIDLLGDFQFSMRSEAAGSLATFAFLEKSAKRSDIIGFFQGDGGNSASLVGFRLWPDGWWDTNKSRMTDFFFRVNDTVDPSTRRAYPEEHNPIMSDLNHLAATPAAYAPWNVFYMISAPAFTGAMPKFAASQVWVDEMRIACALERYRLAKGAYPDSLDALAPAYFDVVPHDIMNGEAYHYRLNADGTFQLYSVGWNLTDDGGKVVLDKNKIKRDDMQGDWVWPTPKG